MPRQILTGVESYLALINMPLQPAVPRHAYSAYKEGIQKVL
jgi:hypothetical protein